MYWENLELTAQMEKELREQFEDAIRIMKQTGDNIVYVRRPAEGIDVKTVVAIGFLGGAASLDKSVGYELGEHCRQEYRSI